MGQLDQKIRTLMKVAFNSEVPSQGDFSKDQINDWDSLNHVELIFLLEEEFGVQFTPEQIEKIQSLSSIEKQLVEMGIEP